MDRPASTPKIPDQAEAIEELYYRPMKGFSEAPD
jgi:hypothetical protein